jgi:hypothetical protein
MSPEIALIREQMRTPRAAAIAGIIFSLLMIAAQLLIRTSISTISLGPATNVVSHSNTISLAFHLISFAGIAFLWFIAVVRDRLGKFEDRFFATVFLGSGLLYIAMMFAAAAVAGGLMRVLVSGAENLIQSGSYILARSEINQISNVYGTRMAAVFMFSTCTISLRTRIAPRWIAFLGYIVALVLLLGVGTIDLIPLVFPLWIFVISVYILVDNLRGQPQSNPTPD